MMDKIYSLNLLKDDIDDRDRILNSRKYLIESNVVKEIDHSQNMSPVKNQGKLGSCVSFAVTALKEWQEKKEYVFEKYILGKDKKRNDNEEYDFSEQWLYYNCKKIDAWPNEEGTSIRYAMKVLKSIGIPVEEGWRYNDIDKGKPESWATLVARWNKISSYSRITDINLLKNALLDSPVPIGIGVFREMFEPGDSGIVNDPLDRNTMYGGHAICAVGFSDRTELVKFKNSWGTDWGDGGYGYISYKYINDFMWDAWIAEDLRVTKDMLKNK